MKAKDRAYRVQDMRTFCVELHSRRRAAFALIDFSTAQRRHAMHDVMLQKRNSARCQLFVAGPKAIWPGASAIERLCAEAPVTAKRRIEAWATGS